MYNTKFYDPAKVGTLFLPRLAEVEVEADSLSIASSAADKNRIALLMIDMQIDFCHQNGSLYVPGAEDDIRRLITFILNNMDKITSMYASLDSHLLFQIFFRSWWRTAKNEKPAYFDAITKSAIEAGQYQPVVDPIASIDYTDKLESNAKKQLMIWTYHTMIGTPGQAMDPALYEILAYHGFARKSQPNFLQKGSIPQTEMYGILCPEVKISTHKQGGFNTDFLNILMKHNKVIITGQAKSHCVLESIKQIYNFFGKTDPDVLKKIYIFEDCMSSVKHPVVDFEAIAKAEFEVFSKAGMNIIKSTDFKA